MKPLAETLMELLDKKKYTSRGDLEPWEVSLITMEEIRSISLSIHNEPVACTLILNLLYATGTIRLSSTWVGRIPEEILRDGRCLLDEQEQSREQFAKTTQLPVPSIIERCFRSPRLTHWLMAVDYMRSIADQELISAKGAYEVALSSLTSSIRQTKMADQLSDEATEAEE